MKIRLPLERQEDRDAVALGLFHNGYGVKQGKQKKGKRYVPCIVVEIQDDVWREYNEAYMDGDYPG